MSSQAAEKNILNFNNVIEIARKAVEEFQRLKAIVNDDENHISNLSEEQLVELVESINRVRERLKFLKKRKSVRLLKRRLISRLKRKSKNTASRNDELIDFKINEFFQTEQLFGTFKKFDHNIEDQIKEDKLVFSSTLTQVNSSLFELKELKDFASCLLKLVNLRARQSQKERSKVSVRQLNEIFRQINERKLENEELKSSLHEVLNAKHKSSTSAYKKLPNRKKFYSILARVEKSVRESLFGKSSKKSSTLVESELSIENLIYIRREWDRFLVESSDREKSVPLHWVEPNQTPNDEWIRFVKK